MHKVLHISHAYPTRVNEYDGDFVRRHYNSVKEYSSYLIHVQMDSNCIETFELVDNEEANELIIYIPKGHMVSQLKNTVKAYLVGYQKVLLKFGKPNLIHGHFTLHSGLIALIFKLKFGVPFIITEHSTVFTSKQKSLKLLAYRFIAKFYLLFANAVLPVSHDLARNLPVDIKKSTVIPNVVGTSFFGSRSANNNKIRFVHVSSLLEDQKNISGILKAIESLSDEDFEFIFIGSENLDLLQVEIKRRGLKDKIKVLGPLSNDEVANQILQSHVFVLFSRYENLPCVLLEAQCAGLYCISSNVGGVNEIIDDEKKGIIVQSEDISALTRAMRKCIELKINHSFIREASLRRYSSSTIKEQIEKVYSLQV